MNVPDATSEPSAMTPALQHKLVRAVQCGPASIFLTDAGGELEFANQAFCAANGLSPDEVSTGARGFLSAFVPADQLTAMWAAVRAGQAWRAELRHQRADGQIVWDELVVSPILDSEGGLSGLVGGQKTITLRKRAELGLQQSEERLQRVLAAARDGIVMVNGHGEVELWNDSATRILGYSHAEMVGKDFHDSLVPTRDRETQRLAFAQFQKSGQGDVIDRTVEMWTQRKDGTEILVELSLSALQFDNQWHALAIIRDVSERKKAETERELLLKSLEEALASVKTLRGLVPICAACKKIRDDKGFWSQVESYVAAHSEATFTHGICPDCARRLYPEYLSGEQDTGGVRSVS